MTKVSQIDKDLIRAIAELVNEADLAEIELEKDDFRLRVTRSFSGPGAVQAIAPAAGPAVPPPAAMTPTAPAPAAEDDLSAHPGTLTSPMVGTAYGAPEPGAASFVEPGSRVHEGQTVLIIEAMKTMNQIPAHRSGTISQILFEDGQPVEYGEPLVMIE